MHRMENIKLLKGKFTHYYKKTITLAYEGNTLLPRNSSRLAVIHSY